MRSVAQLVLLFGSLATLSACATEMETEGDAASRVSDRPTTNGETQDVPNGNAAMDVPTGAMDVQTVGNGRDGGVDVPNVQVRDVPNTPVRDVPNVQMRDVPNAPVDVPNAMLTGVGVRATWHIDLEAPVRTDIPADVYDIDLFDNSADVIRTIKARGRRVICYFSAGSYENWRPDEVSFPRAGLGSNLAGWPGERWLDVRNAGVRSVMQRRMDLAEIGRAHV